MRREQRFVETVAQLKTLLRAERSAVDVYTNALADVKGDACLAIQLERCRSSHQQRATFIGAAITRYANAPAAGVGSQGWESFSRLIRTGSGLAARDAAIAALDQGQGYGRRGYRENLQNVVQKMKHDQAAV